MTAMEAKRAELETLAAENPGCLTVPAVAKFLDLKPDRVQDWLESANCPIKAIVYPTQVPKRTATGNRLPGTRDGRMYYRIPTLPFYNWYLNGGQT